MARLLDTCVLIDLLRGRDAAVRAVRDEAEPPLVCAISVTELYAGVLSQREEARVERLLSLFQFVRVDIPVFRRAGTFLRHYQASHGLDLPDALIAATAEHHGLELATLNVKHFPMFPRLKPPY